MRKTRILLLFAIFLVSCTGCTRKEASSTPKAVRISATNAFVTYFGPAPTTEKGTCYAFVIYFPTASAPGKVTPFPFFTFDETSMKKVALERLISGMDEKSYAGQFLQLFPPGARLVSLSPPQGDIVADFTKELGPVAADPSKADALYNSIFLTLKQFAGVNKVVIRSDGRDLFPAKAAPAESAVVVQPGAPRLLNVIAAKRSAAAPIAEIDALFDRPVDIKRCSFTTAEGAQIQGTVYHSMFDMAAVLKPSEPAKLSSGAGVKVQWEVADKVGRTASGEHVFPLEVQVHQD